MIISGKVWDDPEEQVLGRDLRIPAIPDDEAAWQLRALIPGRSSDPLQSLKLAIRSGQARSTALPSWRRSFNVCRMTWKTSATCACFSGVPDEVTAIVTALNR